MNLHNDTKMNNFQYKNRPLNKPNNSTWEVYRQLGDFSQRRGPVWVPDGDSAIWGSASWGSAS